MTATRGAFIVLEGTDGSGKGTQFKLLAEQLQQAGYDVALFDFPQYDQPSSYFVKRYLNSEYGTAEEVGPYTGSLFYALDRYDAAAAIRQALEEGRVVLANRFTASNMAHQGTKFENAEQRRGYFIWLDNLEFETLRIPRPDLNIVLRVPARIAQQLVDQKEARDYTDKKRDLHEADLQHLERAVEVYDDLCQLFPKDFSRIDCVRGGELLSIEVIHRLVSEKVLPLLPPPQNAPPIPVSDGSDSRHDASTSGNVQNGEQNGVYPVAATQAATNQPAAAQHDGNSAQQPMSIPLTVENASNLLTQRLEQGRLAVYSEQSPDYVYDEYNKEQEVSAPRKINTNGVENNVKAGPEDEKAKKYKYYMPEHLHASTMQAYGQAMTDILSHYATLVQKLTDYVREHSSVPEAERDAAWMEDTRAQAHDAARAVLPVATTSTVEIYASVQPLETLIIQLLADDLPEVRKAGERLLGEVRKIVPAFLEDANEPDHDTERNPEHNPEHTDTTGPTTAYLITTRHAVRELARHFLPTTHVTDNTHAADATHVTRTMTTARVQPAIHITQTTPTDDGQSDIMPPGRPAPTAGDRSDERDQSNEQSSKPVTLTGVWPRNELDIVADILYEHSHLPLNELRQITEEWPYDRKAEVLATYIGKRRNPRDKPGRALEKIRYSWDVVCDFATFRDLQHYRTMGMVDGLAMWPGECSSWQELTPRYGYDTPRLVEDAGLSYIFDECFDISLHLYSLLRQDGHVNEAQYAMLLGHKMRWQATYSARDAFDIHEHSYSANSKGHSGYRKLVLMMHEKVAEVHPLLASGMRFANGRKEDRSDSVGN